MSISRKSIKCEDVAPSLEPFVSIEEFRKIVEYDTTIQIELCKRFNFNKGELANKHILMVGAGTLGNEVAKNLIFSGVANLTIVDLDKYEIWNLPRSPMVSEKDVGRPKAIALAERMAERSPFSATVTGIDADITMLGWGFLKNFDLVLSPVDSLGIRYFVDRGCKLYNVPHITLATTLLKQNNIRDGYMSGDIIVSPAGSDVCYACTEFGGANEIQKRIHCGDGYSADVQPQVMGFSSTIAGIASTIAINYLLGKFQLEDNDALGDLSKKYWKYVLNEVGISYKELSAKNLGAIVYSSPYNKCCFHKGSDICESGEVHWNFDDYGQGQATGHNEIPTIYLSSSTTATELLDMIHNAFKGWSGDIILDLEGWSMLFYSVYKTKDRIIPEEARSDSYIWLLDEALNVKNLSNKLPKEHVYRIAKDGGFDAARLIKLVIER